jgi:hypothetical protein
MSVTPLQNYAVLAITPALSKEKMEDTTSLQAGQKKSAQIAISRAINEP